MESLTNSRHKHTPTLYNAFLVFMSIVSGGCIVGFIGGPKCGVKVGVIQQNQMHEER